MLFRGAIRRRVSPVYLSGNVQVLARRIFQPLCKSMRIIALFWPPAGWKMQNPRAGSPWREPDSDVSFAGFLKEQTGNEFAFKLIFHF